MAIEYDPVLIEGSDQKLQDYIWDTGKSIIVDHREEEATIVEYMARIIPEAGLTCEFAEDDDLVVTYKGQPTKVGLTFSPKDRYITIRKLNSILAGDYEIRVFRATLDSDTHSLYVKSSEWWASMDAYFPDRIAHLFAKITDEIDFA